jgi:hypothetical protein
MWSELLWPDLFRQNTSRIIINEWQAFSLSFEQLPAAF